MPIFPTQPYRFHEATVSQIRKWKKDPSFKEVTLQYGLNPSPWATLNSLSIPLPRTHTPYGSWPEWFRDYLEDQLALISEETKVPIYRSNKHKEKIQLRRKEKIELSAPELSDLMQDN